MVTQPHVRRAGIYCRLSYALDGSVEKVDRQEGDCRQLAGRLTWPVSEEHIYKDNSRSAWKRNRKRPGWDSMLAAIDAGEIDAIIVYHGDRLIRQPYDLEKLLNIADQRGIRLASPSGTRNLDSPDDRFILRIEAAQACRESDNTSRRVKRALDARVTAGAPRRGGRRTFGFETDGITHITTEVQLLQKAAEQLLGGQSIGGLVRWLNEVSSTTTDGLWTAGRAREWAARGEDELAERIQARLVDEEPTGVARDLNTEGITCPIPARWTSRVIKSLLTSLRMVALMEVDGQWVPGAWEPVLDRDVWESVRMLLSDRAEQYPTPGSARLYLLTGWAQCGTCKAPMGVHVNKTRKRPKPHRVYICKNSACEKRLGRSVKHLDTYVTGRVLRRLQAPDLLDKVLAPDPGSVAEIVALEERKAQALAQFASLADHPDITPEMIAKSVASFSKRIVEKRERHATTARQRLLARHAGITLEQWEETPIDVRASIVRALFRVVVLPATWRGPGFDPASVRLEPIEADGGQSPPSSSR